MNYNLIDTIDCNIVKSQDFHDYFQSTYRMMKPLCLKSFAKNWNALERWRDLEYLQSISVERNSCIMKALDGQTFLKHELSAVLDLDIKMALEKIMKEDSHERLYCRLYFDTQPTLAADTNYQEVESLVFDERDTNKHFEAKNCGIWISSAGCITPLHYDLCHGLLAQIVGRKRFILASPDDTMYLYPNRDPHSKNQTSSLVNLTDWISSNPQERRRFPTIDEAQWYLVDLDPGDILYTPPGWWHYVVSLDQSISVLLPFDMLQQEHLHPLQCV